jgi:serine/threonine protein kinase/Flp pilus assembly protein TadD
MTTGEPNPNPGGEARTVTAAGSDPAVTRAEVPSLDAYFEDVGTVLGPYRLVERLGEGGFGSVWLADQQEPVKRQVAFKILKLGMDTRQVVARFEAERQTLALMDHPNIATVLDAGATVTGRPFFVMELVRGLRMTEFCDQHRMDLRSRVRLFITVCHAIQHAHQKGIIHRDIKPSNILVRMHEGAPLPKVIDFGIAKATGPVAADPAALTQEHQIVGTPAYMSPEQMVPGSADIDTRSDIYALGVLLYELLTGQTPFDSRTLLRSGFDALRRALAELEPPPPSVRWAALGENDRSATAGARGLDSIRLERELRGDLDWIVLKCLEKERARRYATANGLAADLQRYLDDEPVVARPPSRRDRFAKLVRRHKFAFAAAGGVFAALVFGLGIATWMFFEEREARHAARTAAEKSAEVAGFLESMLDGVGPAVALGRDTALLRDILDRTAERVGRDLRRQPEVELELRRTIGRTYAAIGALSNAAAVQERALELGRRIDSGPRTNLATILTDLGSTRLQEGRDAEAEALQQESLRLLVAAYGRDHVAVSEPLRRLGTLRSREGKLAEAEALLTEAVRLRRRDWGDDDARTFAALRSLAVLYYRQERHEYLEGVAAGLVESGVRVLGPEHPWVTDVRVLLALAVQEQGRFEDAERLHREVLAAQRKVAGEGHLDTLATSSNLGLVLMFQGRFEEAERLFEEAHVRQEQALGPEHPDTLASLSNLAELRRDQGRIPEAEALFRRVAEVHARTLPESHPNRLENRQGLLVLLAGQGRWEEAEPLARDLLRLRALAYPAGHPKIADSLGELTRVLLARGAYTEAESFARSALEIRLARQTGNWRRFLAEARLGAVLLGLGRTGEARLLLTAGIEGLRACGSRIPFGDRDGLAFAESQWRRLAAPEAGDEALPASAR